MGPSFPSCQQLLCDLEQVTWGLGTVLLAESCEGAGGHLDKAGSAHTARPWPGSSKHTADSGWANKALSLLPSRTHGQGGWGLAVLRLQGQVIHSPGVYLQERHAVCAPRQPLSAGAPAPSSPQCSSRPPLTPAQPGGGQWGSLAWSSPSGVWRHGGCSSYSSSSGYKQAAERATRCLEVGQVSGGGTGVQVWPSARSRTGG